MKVYPKDKKMTKLLTNPIAIQKKYGAICGSKVMQRLNELRSAVNLTKKLERTSKEIGAKFPYTTTDGKYEEFAISLAQR